MLKLIRERDRAHFALELFKSNNKFLNNPMEKFLTMIKKHYIPYNTKTRESIENYSPGVRLKITHQTKDILAELSVSMDNSNHSKLTIDRVISTINESKET